MHTCIHAYMPCMHTCLACMHARALREAWRDRVHFTLNLMILLSGAYTTHACIHACALCHGDHDFEYCFQARTPHACIHVCMCTQRARDLEYCFQVGTVGFAFEAKEDGTGYVVKSVVDGSDVMKKGVCKVCVGLCVCVSCVRVMFVCLRVCDQM
jgi:hypothetical protein